MSVFTRTSDDKGWVLPSILPTIYERVKALIGMVQGASPNSGMQPPAGSD